jgi:hypothetical protein
MRSFLIISILTGFLTIANSQVNKTISIPELIAIHEKSDFAGLVDIVHRHSYVVVDSSKSEDGALIYITRNGDNVLACNILPNKIMNLLGYYVLDSILSNELKKQIADLGYTTKGKSKFEVPGYIETQEFNKAKNLVAFGIKKLKNGKLEYGFEILRF